jgi:hypothetical protein
VTNESDTYAQAEPGKAPGSTFERKEMSFKTLRKRIALVAVSALAVTGLSTVSANAAVSDATGNIVVTSALIKGASGATTSASQAIGNQVVLTWHPSADNTYYLTSDSGGSIISAADTAGSPNAWDYINGLNYSNGATEAAASFDHTKTQVIALTSTQAGTQVVKIATLNASTGLYSTVAAATITWLAASGEAAVDASQSTVYVVQDGDTCVFGSNKSGDVNAANANAETVTSVPAGTTVDVCFIGRDKNGNRVAAGASTVVISSAGATQDAESAVGNGYVSEQTAAASSTFTGKATYTVIFVDVLGNAATLTTSLTYYGDIASISISNPDIAGGYAALKGGANNAATSASTLAALTSSALPGSATSGIGYLAIVAKDKGGNVINLSAAGNNDLSGFTIDSDFTAGAPAAGSSDSAGATIALSDGAGDISPDAFGANIAIVRCGTSAVAEKLTITVIGINASSVKLPSPAAATFYCSGSVDKVAVTNAANSINVNAVDAKGYPVADGTSVLLAASNGAVVAPSTKTTVNGKFATGATFLPSSTSASAVVTAIIGSKVGSSTPIAGTGSSVETQVSSLVAAIAKLQAAINKINKRLKR